MTIEEKLKNIRNQIKNGKLPRHTFKYVDNPIRPEHTELRAHSHDPKKFHLAKGSKKMKLKYPLELIPTMEVFRQGFELEGE